MVHNLVTIKRNPKVIKMLLIKFIIAKLKYFRYYMKKEIYQINGKVRKPYCHCFVDFMEHFIPGKKISLYTRIPYILPGSLGKM